MKSLNDRIRFPSIGEMWKHKRYKGPINEFEVIAFKDINIQYRRSDLNVVLDFPLTNFLEDFIYLRGSK